MAENIMKENECFQKDYDKLYAKDVWSKDDLEQMKDLKKLMYYNLVIDAMENGGEYPGSEHMPEMSYARGRNRMGQFTSGNNGMTYGNWNANNASGMYYPEYPMMNGNRYYDGMNTSGRRYYDSERENAIHMLHHMMEDTDDKEKKSKLKLILSELEQK